MQVFEESFDKLLKKMPEKIFESILDDKLAEFDIELSSTEKNKLKEHLLSGKEGSLRIRGWRFWERKNLKLDFTEEDAQEFDIRFERFREKMPELTVEFVDTVADSMYFALKQDWAKESRLQRKDRLDFEKHHYAHWKQALEMLAMLLTISHDFGSKINHEIRNNQIDISLPFTTEVLTRLHARACLVTHEILALLTAGFADGAMARWRTLHEISVTAFFIEQHGENLAEKYISHGNVEAKKAADNYESCKDRLGYEPLDSEEIQNIETSYQEVIQRYGRDFKGPYGWAAQQLNNPRPSFRDIEVAANIDHLRAHYQMASYNVHANPKGAFFKLGLLDEMNILLSGPSVYGLSDPGQLAAISLLQVTSTLLNLNPNIDNLVVMKIMTMLEQDTTESFVMTQQNLEKESVQSQ